MKEPSQIFCKKLTHHNLIYIGNDIVDLRATGPQQRHRNPRWLDKVFNPEEQSHILASEQPEHQLWTLWAAKESAYKVFLKQERRRQFRPKDIQIHVGEGRWAYYAKYKGQQIGIHQTDSRFFAHCVALSGDYSESQSNVLNLPDCSPEEGRERIYHSLCQSLQNRGWPAPFEIQKCELGIPHLKGWEDYCDLSFSHHGAFYAYAIAFAPLETDEQEL